ncbi:major royal jelly protein-domain-containing protein [Crucibulum laeve]|uniref:Major royal jelly protein-domain-containing protein n=1 Tax=Crucibulum laeve TaxID=68775 RepID=A0A5C3M3F1_9AGAR|nr:major royal jelly protein-domain-containing protein [Crucibulum laeve]
MRFAILLYSVLTCILVSAVKFQPLSEKPGLVDNGTFGPTLEVVHLFQKEPPIGITISKSGRAFVTFNRGDLAENPITLGEIVSPTEEVAFPSAEFNTPPEGLVNTSSGRPLGSSDSKHFINVQAVVIDSRERLWVLDTGRPVVDGDNLLAALGGPKLMGFDLESNSTIPFTIITFPEDVLPPTGYLNDVRFDLTSSLTSSGKGVAYIADSGGFGIIVVDLGTGKSWRHLDKLHSVSPRSRFLPTLFGIPTYSSTPMSPALHYENAGGGGGIDGFAIGADGKHLYFTPLASRDLYRIETAPLLVNPAEDKLAFIRAANSIQYLGEFGGQADGLETDSAGKIYLSSPEHNSINTFDPSTGLVSPFVRSPIIAWPDTLSVADDSFIYATLNQLWLSPGFQNGTDKRVKPFALVRAKIDGQKVKLG